MRLAAISICFAFTLTAGASAAVLEPVGDFETPMSITSAPANPDRLLVAERKGRVMEVNAGAVGVFADLTSLVSCCASARGLLSIVPALDFATSGNFYAVYTGNATAGSADGDIHVDRFRQEGGALVREPILTIGYPATAQHYGGQLQLGPDGYLYLSTGDGGGQEDPLGSGQNLTTLLSKILRFEPRPGAEPEIWSYGLRNPWRFSFDRASGDMVIADVGHTAREEIDLAQSPAAGVVGGAGTNYGWSCREGAIAYSAAPASCTGTGGFTDPVFDYPHLDPDPEEDLAHGCSITGGYVVRDPSLGDLYGRYIYADFCVGEIRSLELPESAGGEASGDRSEGLSVPSPISFGEDSCGRLYVASNGGAVHRLVGETPTLCQSSPSLPDASDSPVGIAGAGNDPVATAVATGTRPPRVRLGRGSHASGGDLKLLLVARATPCPAQAGGAVQLHRGGRQVQRRQLNRRCVARFRLNVDRRSTFRALLLEPGGETVDRSPPLHVPGAQAAG